jgi:hypothetical protein
LCLFSLDPSIRIDRTPIVPGTSFGLTLNLADGFDTLITVQIHNVNGRLAPTNASVSLVAHVVYGEGRVKQSVIIGAEHIVFHAGMRLSRGILRAAASKPAFYFRTKIGDTDVFPRKGNVSRSPGKSL